MKKWYILFTGYENSLATMKRLVKSCLPRGCGAYIPTTVKNNKDRPTRVYNQPIYPFYLFICCTDSSHLGILKKKMSQLKIDGYFLTDPDGTIVTLTTEEVRDIMENAEDTIKAPSKITTLYKPGDTIVVSSGPLSGLCGRVAYITHEYVYVSVLSKTTKNNLEIPLLVSDIARKEKDNDR